MAVFTAGQVLSSTATFNLLGDAGDSSPMLTFLEEMPIGSLVVCLVIGDGSQNLGADTKVIDNSCVFCTDVT
jgi:hypothetical protein